MHTHLGFTRFGKRRLNPIHSSLTSDRSPDAQDKTRLCDIWFVGRCEAQEIVFEVDYKNSLEIVQLPLRTGFTKTARSDPLCPHLSCDVRDVRENKNL